MLAAREFPDYPFNMRVRVSQGVLSQNQIKMVRPEYPAHVRVAGAVVLRVLVGRDGLMKEISLVSGHPMLTDAAIAAVRQWAYRPYTLNGEPVEVESQIVVNFTVN